MEMEQKPKTDDRQDEHEEEAEGERHVTAMQKFVGFVMLVLGWLQLLLAVSSGSWATCVSFLNYFSRAVLFIFRPVSSSYTYPFVLAATISGLVPHYHLLAL